MDPNMFDQAIGNSPPSTVDVEAIIARGRRAVWVHRAANPWTATAATVMVIAAGAVALLPGNSAGSGGYVAPASQPGGSVSATTPPASSTSPPPGMHCVTETATIPPPSEDPDAARRLTGVLTAAVEERLAAGTQLTPNPEHLPKGASVGPLEFYHETPAQSGPYGCPSGASGFSAAATTEHAGKKGNVSASVSRLSEVNRPSCAAYAPGVVSDMAGTCQRQPDGPHGEVIIYTTDTSKRPGGGPTIYTVYVVKSDGTNIGLSAENVGDTAKNNGHPETQQPPLTHEQLAAIALDPGMTLYPH